MAVVIKVEGVEQLLSKLSEPRYRGLVADGMRAAALHVKGQIARYPPVRRGPQPAKTDRQRRWQHWAGRQGLLPYRRSGRLGRGWSVRLDAWNVATVSNLVEYGPLVQQAGSQARYHVVTGWVTDEVVAARTTPAVQAFLEARINSLF